MWLQSALFDYDDLWSQIEFRLVMAYDVVTTPQWCHKNERLGQNELWLMRAGRCRVQSGNQHAIAQSGDIVLLRSGEYRLTTEADGAPLDLIGFGFHAHLLGTVELLSLLEAPLCFANRSANLATSLENMTRESREQLVGHGLATAAYAQLALVEALRDAFRVLDVKLQDESGEDESGKKVEFEESLHARVLRRLQETQNGDIAQALQLIANRYAEPLEIAQIARSLHLSPAHFSRKFKAALGVGPTEYLRTFRLRRARVLLGQNDDAISRVAQSCGFPDAAYFSRAFKAQFSSSPLEFRQTVRALSK